MSLEPPRFKRALQRFAAAHSTDPTSDSAAYHASLDAFVRKLSALTEPPSIPSEALLLAANCQHIRRWEHPRDSYPAGLSGYKTWRTKLNQFHARVAEETMVEAGYDEVADAALIERVKDLVLKKGLARPPLIPPYKDPEMQLFEDAICLVFLAVQFVDFAQKISDEEKMVVIVRKTWAKMTDVGRGVVARELLPELPEDLKMVVSKALA